MDFTFPCTEIFNSKHLLSPLFQKVQNYFQDTFGKVFEGAGFLRWGSSCPGRVAIAIKTRTLGEVFLREKGKLEMSQLQMDTNVVANKSSPPPNSSLPIPHSKSDVMESAWVPEKSSGENRCFHAAPCTERSATQTHKSTPWMCDGRFFSPAYVWHTERHDAAQRSKMTGRAEEAIKIFMSSLFKNARRTTRIRNCWKLSVCLSACSCSYYVLKIERKELVNTERPSVSRNPKSCEFILMKPSVECPKVIYWIKESLWDCDTCWRTKWWKK